MTRFGIEVDIGMKEITSDQATPWAFGNLFVPFGLPKIIVVGADGIFTGMFKKTFQETLLIQVHSVARVNHKEIRNEGFHRYLNKLHKVNSADKGILHQWLRGVLFALYAWNDVLFLDFWKPGDIPDQDGSHKILTCLDCMTGFGIEEDIGRKEITSDQATPWAFGNLFDPFGLQYTPAY